MKEIDSRPLLIGEIEPSLGINLANSISSKVIIFTIHKSSYCYYLMFKNDNVDVVLVTPSNDTLALAFCEEGLLKDNISYYKSLYSTQGIKDVSELYIRSLLASIFLRLKDYSKDTSVLVWNCSGIINSSLVSRAINFKNLNVIENGFIRPATVTLDYSGVNIDSSYFSMGTKCFKFDRYKTVVSKVYSRKSYIPFRLIEYVAGQKISKSQYSLAGLIKSWVRKLYFNRFVKSNDVKFPVLKQPFNLLPLQLIYDAQCIKYSKYNSYEDIIIDGLSYSNPIPLVVTIHPLDVNFKELISTVSTLGEKYSNLSLSLRPTSELINSASTVITVNSTVGFEALLLGKPVKLLGSAIYSKCSGVLGADSPGATLESFIDSTQVTFDVSSYSTQDLHNLISYLC